MQLLKPEPVAPPPNATPLFPVNVFAKRYVSMKPEWQYVSPDKSVFLPVDDGFVKGITAYGTKFAEIVHAYGLAPVHPGHPFYISDELEEQTFKVSVSPSGAIEKIDLFAQAGGEGVSQDRDGNVYIAAGQIKVFSPNGDLKGQIDVPERPINLMFGGADGRTLYILTHNSLYSVRTKTPGL
jgi:sugar lactone lactonase YvrE